jgi:hypothetical protein
MKNYRMRAAETAGHSAGKADNDFIMVVNFYDSFQQ